MQISVIIPIYKVEQYIERCLKSVIMQTFTDYEVILVDDASPDNALQIAEKLLIENRIEYQTIKHPENQGLSEARNSGIKVAKGKYLMFIDSDDDLPNKEVLQWFYDATKEDDYDFITARVNFFELGELKPFYHKHFSGKKILKNTEILESWMWFYITNEAWNKLIKTDFLYKHQLVFQKGYYYEDLPWVFNLCRNAKKTCVLPRLTYNYYFQLNDNAITNNVNKEKINHLVKHFQYILNEINDDIELKTSLPTTHIRRLVMGNFNYILCDKKVIKDKNLWLFAYKSFSKVYKSSFLWKTKKQLTLPSSIAYRVVNISIDPNFNKQSFFIRKVITELFYFNFKYKGEI